MFRKIPFLLAAILVMSVSAKLRANWFDYGSGLIKSAANYTRHNPKTIVDVSLIVAAVGCVAYLTYQSRRDPTHGYALEDGDWEQIPVYEPPPFILGELPLAPVKVPMTNTVTARSPILNELIFDVTNRQNRVSGLNSEAHEI